ncbi:hypothetical protein [Rhizobium sp. RM]|uniref:hypothetical protein n=1 Tax=Rhizobium sp. RM TaxID=2748079 RepID=UPI00110E63BA|nr:hypothetical protein [Rhizobium sp. RM]NWJ27604.1 hypothetical protein [Rhizobium sp. RM]TMV19946.1 hypothetical protein BJG94_11090 [Rhizobium sp. Td3]
MSSLEKPAVREDGLQLEEHRRFQERFWAIERFSWGVFAVIILAALLGVFGSGGPLATQVSELESAILEHPRIGRWEGTDEMAIRFKPDSTSNERSLLLSNAFAEVFQVEDIQPLPTRTTIEANGQRLFFDSPARNGGVVTLHIRAQAAGPANFDVMVDDELISLFSFIFP